MSDDGKTRDLLGYIISNLAGNFLCWVPRSTRGAWEKVELYDRDSKRDGDFYVVVRGCVRFMQWRMFQEVFGGR